MTKLTLPKAAAILSVIVALGLWGCNRTDRTAPTDAGAPSDPAAPPDDGAPQPDPTIVLDDGLMPDNPVVGSVRPAITVLVAYHSETGNTETMAQAVASGAQAVPGATVVLKRIGDVAASDLVAADALIVGSPVYFGSMSGEVKTFFDKWRSNFNLFEDRKMRNKIGGAFATGTAFSNGKELTLLTISAAMLINEMVVVSGGGGFGATAATGPDSPGIDEKEIAEARALGTRVAEVAEIVKKGAS